MARFKIRSKKPKDPIKVKTPEKEPILSITEKTPDDTEKQFHLPPSRKYAKNKINKESFTHPTSYGLKEGEKKPSTTNTVPPLSQVKSKKNSRIPSNKGSLPKSIRKKVSVNQKVPKHSKKIHKQRTLPPSRIGISEKKPSKITNKTPPQHLHTKKPKEKTIPPPSTLNSTHNLKKTSISKPPPKSKLEKVSMNSKSVPPTIINTKIPKDRIKAKKPD